MEHKVASDWAPLLMAVGLALLVWSSARAKRLRREQQRKERLRAEALERRSGRIGKDRSGR